MYLEVNFMNIVTCIKQVPASSKVDVDPVTGVLIRDGNNVKMNPYDLYALEASFFIKDKAVDAVIEVVTMGPPSAMAVLNEAMYMGADKATLISDRKFAGADVLATAYTLSQLIEHISDYDVIVCGKQTTDGDTAQVGPEIAEFLSVPHIPYVIEIIEVKDQSIIVKSAFDSYEEINEVKTPCLLTIEKGDFIPRLPSYRRKVEVSGYEVKTVTMKDLKDQDLNHYGLNGSPTQVEEIFPPSKRRDSIKVKGCKKELSKKIVEILVESRFI